LDFSCSVKKKFVWWPRKDFEMSGVLYNAVAASESVAGLLAGTKSPIHSSRPIAPDCRKSPQSPLAGEIRNQFLANFAF